MRGPPGPQNPKGRQHSEPQWAEGASIHCRLPNPSNSWLPLQGDRSSDAHCHLQGFLFPLLPKAERFIVAV